MSSMYIFPGRAYDSAGIIAPESQHYFTDYTTGAPSAPYQDAALTVPHMNPVLADGVGNIPNTYMDPGITYRVRVYDSQAEAGVGTPLEDFNPYLFGGGDGKREQLSGNRDYFVRTDGADDNPGLDNTPSGAFLTIQKAIATAYALDCNGFSIAIHVADGTYTDQVSIIGALLDPNSTPLRITGNTSTPANVLLSTVGDTVHLSHGAYVLLEGMKLTSATGGLLVCDFHSTIEHQNLDMGSATASGGAMFTPHFGGIIRALGTTTISGNADSCCHVTTGGLVYFSSMTVNFTGTPNTFAVYLWGINNAAVYLDSATITWTNQPTGQITVHDRSILNVSSLTGNYMPTGGIDHVDNGSTIATGLLNFREIYVDASASSDHTDGLTTTRPFKTIQGCISFWSRFYYDPEMWAPPATPVNINLAAGTYTETVKLYDLPWLGALIIGADKSTTTIAGVTDALFATGGRTLWSVQKVKITASAGSCLRAEMGGNIDFSDVDFGAATVAHIKVNSGGKVRPTGSYTISDGATAHIQARMGLVDYGFTTSTVTLTGTPTFSDAFIRCDQGSHVYVSKDRNTFSGSASGAHWNLHTCSTMDTDGDTSIIPGNAANTVDASSKTN